MTLKILSSLILCGILFPLNAQIKGVVSDTDNNPIEFANVAVYYLHIYQSSLWDTRELEVTVRYKFNTNGNRYKGTGAGESEFKRL